MKKLGMMIIFVLFSLTAGWAGDEAPTIASNKTAIDLVQSHADYVWTLVAAMFVFFMQAGFAMVEAGFTRAKNAVNIMMKNLMDFSMGSIVFFAVGFGLMFGVSKTGFFGTTGFFLSDFTVGGDPWVLAFWMFQAVFAATAATIVSGAMAERTKFSGYLLYSVFNPGSTTAASKDIAMIFVNTNLAAAAGAILAMAVSWIKFGKPEVGMSLNGALAGLVGITAGCANVTPTSAVLIGAIAGVIVVFSVLFFDKIRIDDPVGAISVHGVCGAWGTLAAGIFNIDGMTISILAVQLAGIAACFAWTFPVAYLLFKLIDITIGLRVSKEEELEGLDATEHGGNAYPDFTTINHGTMGSSGGPGSREYKPAPSFASKKMVSQP